MNKEDLERIEELKKRFNKKLENFELDKLCGQLSPESIYSLFPTEIILLLDYINQLETNRDEVIECLKKYKEDMFKKTNSNKTYLKYITPCIRALEILERGKK